MKDYDNNNVSVMKEIIKARDTKNMVVHELGEIISLKMSALPKAV